MSIVFAVKGASIQLDQLLKATGLCSSGGLAHAEISAGKIQVDGLIELRKRAKLRPGQQVSYGAEWITLVEEDTEN